MEERYLVLSHRPLNTEKLNNLEVARIEVKPEEKDDTIGTIFQRLIRKMEKAGALEQGTYTGHYENEDRERVGVAETSQTFGNLSVKNLTSEKTNGGWTTNPNITKTN